MCIVLRYESDKPYKKSRIRWKCVSIENDGRMFAPFLYSEYKVKGWNVAQLNGNPSEEGFHVFVTRKDAREKAKSRLYPSYYSVRKIEVCGFLRSGFFKSKRSETWRQFRFVK